MGELAPKATERVKLFLAETKTHTPCGNRNLAFCAISAGTNFTLSVAASRATSSKVGGSTQTTQNRIK